MSVQTLGRLEKVQIRDIWPGEASDFTPWLALEQNLELLAEAIGMELDFESQEQNVGPYRADILCKDTTSDQWVVIENQFGKTDHSHLGQVITYAAGLEAVTLVWIAEKFTEEHRAAMDWLNEHTNEKINLFGLEIELWRIGNSLAAPKFNVVSQPNDWTKAVQKAAVATADLSDLKKLQLKFWTAFKSYMETTGSFVKGSKPYPQHWMNHSIGRSGAVLAAKIITHNPIRGSDKPEIAVELTLNGIDAKPFYVELEKNRSQFENGVGSPLHWHNPLNRGSCSIFAWNETDFQDETQWPSQFEWLQKMLEKMHSTFGPPVKSYSASIPASADSGATLQS